MGGELRVRVDHAAATRSDGHSGTRERVARSL